MTRIKHVMVANGRLPDLLLLLITLLISAFYVGAVLRVADGRPVAPLDDAYIHFQYARQAAAGQPWQYNSGDAYSTGATSFIYPFILAVAFKLGVQGEQIVWVALALGAASLGVTALVVRRVTAQLLTAVGHPSAGSPLPFLAALFFLLTGAAQWAYFNGMESGLFTLFLLLSWHAFLARRYPANAFWLALAGLTRPEGLLLAGVNGLAVLLALYRQKERPFPWRSLLPAAAALLITALPYLVNVWLTGSAVASGAQAKSWFGNVPFRPVDIALSVLRDYGRILSRLALGQFAPIPWLLAPGALLLALPGWWLLARRGEWPAVLLNSGWVFGGALLTATLITALWQMGRYQVPFLALLIPTACVGAVALWELRLVRVPVPVAYLLGGGLLALTLFSSYQALTSYALETRARAEQQLAIADWIDQNLPANAIVAVHDAGAIRFVGQRAMVDMIGLTTSGLAAPWRHGMGAVFEAMEALPAPPTHFATYPNAFSIPYLAGTDMFAEMLFQTEPLAYETSGSAEPVQAVYRADWSLADSGNTLQQPDGRRLTAGMELIDRIDVANLRAEASSDFEWWEGAVAPGFPTELKQLPYRAVATELLDGGRLLTGGASFRLAATPGEPILLGARWHAPTAGAMQVTVDGQTVGSWHYPALPGEWVETFFLVPATAVTQEVVEIRLTAVDPAAPVGLYHLWAWQGEMDLAAAAPEQRLDAQFNPDIRLLGFDLAGERFAAGETLPLRLYWQTPQPTPADLKRFVHLYDAAGNLVAQHDGYPYRDARPPFTWLAGETVLDEFSLALPPDLPPGAYQLAVGLYDPVTLRRTAVTAPANQTLPDNRLRLATITIAE